MIILGRIAEATALKWAESQTVLSSHPPRREIFYEPMGMIFKRKPLRSGERF